MDIFAKLFVVKNDKQVLVTIGYNDEDKMHEVKTSIQIDGVLVSAKGGFASKSGAQRTFDAADQEKAEQFAAQMIETLSDLTY